MIEGKGLEGMKKMFHDQTNGHNSRVHSSTIVLNGGKDVLGTFGLTKREWFAGLALQGLLADPNVHKEIVKEAVIFADALMGELKRTEPKQPEPAPGSCI